MKKIFILSLILISIVFSACEKQTETTNLSGTTWKYNDSPEEYILLKFTSKSNIEVWDNFDGPLQKDAFGTYEVENYLVEITLTITQTGNLGGAFLSGQINGDRMVLSDQSGQVGTFIKQ